MISRWLLAGALALAACTSSRQIVLSIDTTAGVPCDIDRIRVVATAAGTTTTEQPLNGARLPVNITLLDDTPDGSFQLEITALKGDVEVMRTSGPLQFAARKDTEAVLLEPRCKPEAPCALSDAMAAGEASSNLSRVACGANVTRYSASVSLDSGQDACRVPGSRSVLMDGTTRPVRLTALESTLASADFQFYGRLVRQVWVTKDGYLSFAQDNPDPEGVVLPGPFDRGIEHLGLPPPVQSVMAFWTTLSLGPTGVCYEIDGAPGNRQLRVTWAHACLTSPCVSDDLNFTVTLDENSQRVAVTYGAMSAGNDDGAHGITATVGMVNDATGCVVEDCALATGLCKDNITPCGYSQVFSNTLQPRVQNMLFTPIVDPE